MQLCVRRVKKYQKSFHCYTRQQHVKYTHAAGDLTSEQCRFFFMWIRRNTSICTAHNKTIPSVFQCTIVG